MNTQPRLRRMTDETNHPADGPEQEITSEASELVGAEAASATPKPATTHDPEGTVPAAIPESELQEEATPAESNAPAPKLERLQKILAQAGIASRRHAEEMITGGRVQVNGQVVTDAGLQGRCRPRPHPRGRQAAPGRRAPALLHAQQASRLRHHRRAIPRAVPP